MGELTEEGKTHFGNLKIFYVLLYSSAAIFFIALALILTDSPEVGLLILAIALIVMTISFVLFYIILYRLWKFIIAKANELGITHSIPTAGQAVGYLFIPFFNFYWLFKGIGKLPLEINGVAKRYDIQRLVPDNLGYIIGSLSIAGIIPFVGYVTASINFLILLPLFIKNCVEVCEQIDISETTPDKTTEVIAAEKINWESIKEFSYLFNKEQYSINYLLGIALFISLAITRVLRILIISGYEDYYYNTLDYYAIGFGIDLIISILFVASCHFATKSWAQPFIWGAVIVAIFFFKSILVVNSQILPEEGFIKIPSLHIERIIKDFIWGFAFMFGFVFAVNVWSAKIWSLVIGFAFSFIIYKALFIALEFGSVMPELNSYYLFSGMDLINLVGRIITALLIYGAIYLHFDNLQMAKHLREPAIK
jgi:hypothetical protein